MLHHLTVALLCAGLIAGNTAICAGLAATPEQRMACCAEGGNCPMHDRASHHAGSTTLMTQLEADACCLSSERAGSTSPLSPAFVAAISFAVLGPGVVTPASVPALVLSDEWRTRSPFRSPPVPRHVLLSVFLV